MIRFLPQALNRRLPWLAALLAIALGVTATTAIARAERLRAMERSRAAVLDRASTLRAELEGFLNARLLLIKGLVAYISAYPDITDEEFNRIARVLLARQPGVDRVSAVRGTIIRHTYPDRERDEIVGADLREIPGQMEILRRLERTRETVIAGPVDLVEGGSALINFTPVFATPPDAPPASGELWGAVTLLIRDRELFEAVGLTDGAGDLRYALRGRDGRGAEGEVFFGDRELFARDPVLLEVSLPNGSWQLAALPAGGWTAADVGPVQFAGWMISLLTGGLIFVLVREPVRLRQANEATERARQTADKANQAKSEFLANMSHELRTPLNGILGYAQILGRDRALDDRQRHGVRIIEQCGTHLLGLINDVLDLSKIEARKLDLNPEPVALGLLLQGVAEMCRLKAEQKGLMFICDWPDDLPAAVLADPKRLRQVLANLLGNAVKFAEAGSVGLGVRWLERPATDGRRAPLPLAKLRFEVSDTGPGMTPEQTARLFRPFEQVGDRQQREAGTGLGLAISQRIANLMGTAIRVESEPGRGSRFWFDAAFPLAEPTPGTEAGGNRRQAIGYRGDRRTVLVVDDREENRLVLRDLLAGAGFGVVEAEDGLAGLERAAAVRPDAIVTDLVMPGLDGFGLARALRSRPEFDAIPILVSSASAFEFERDPELRQHCQGFLPKPLPADALFDALGRVLGLEWIYEVAAEPAADARSGDAPAELPESASLPPPAIATLRQAIEIGDIAAVEAEARRLKAEVPACAAVADRLLALCIRFDDRAIERLLDELDARPTATTVPWP